MIYFNWVSMQNFLSVGKTPVHIDITKNHTTLIRGHNGAGKTTILEAIIYGLFNKPFRKIKIGQLKNCINKKKMLVKINFTVHGIDYEIHRGQSPKVFDLYKSENGEMVKQPATNDMQTHIENDILNTNLKTFTQAVVMASMKYQNFMDLSLPDRRIVVNQMLDLEVLTIMKDLLSKRKSNATKQYNALDSNVMECKYRRDSLEQIIANSNKNLEDDIKAKESTIAEYDTQLSDLNVKMEELKSELDAYNATKPEIDGSAIIAQQEALRAEINNNTNQRMLVGQSYNTDLHLASFYSQNTQCDRCHQPITDEFRNGELERLRDTTEAFKKQGSECNAKIQECNDKLNSLQTQLNELQSWQLGQNQIYDKARQIQASIQSVQSMRSVITEQISALMDKSNDDVTAHVAELEQANIKYGELIASRSEISKELSMCELSAQVLGDKGIKAKILREYLPVINQSINYYLDVMGANYSFVLDEQFDETILSRYRDDFSYGSFSNGEATRINFAIVFMIRKVAMLKNSISTNLLFLDEVFDGALDGEGLVFVTKLLEEMKDSNIFIISHRKEMEELVEHVVDVKKIGNFSHYDGI